MTRHPQENTGPDDARKAIDDPAVETSQFPPVTTPEDAGDAAADATGTAPAGSAEFDPTLESQSALEVQETPAAPAPSEDEKKDKKSDKKDKKADRKSSASSSENPSVASSLAGTTWVALIVGAVVLTLLLVFILQNLDSVKLQLFIWEWNFPIGVGMLIAAIGGALLMACVGGLRIIQLRRQINHPKK
ncbi:MAG TPA: DUF1049 domain-containing protein [Candidatus Corynebacterium avicola]|uniref:DUF1049 domain-containing protein n=1 Tax=Candidatus Corynebacterium avicola TaxID=2838527 RepID=A0A9D1UL18_9CORY|nr:DUF1049 domain-containing protein [Candidatus Corynebacterium avicola]